MTSQLRGHIKIMLKYEDPPEFLIVHVGTNDLGNMSLGDLRNKLQRILKLVAEDLPGTRLVWSQMLPRLKWRYSKNNKAMEKGRYRVNNAVAKFILNSGGYYLRYPDIVRNEKLFNPDGVHLSCIGNNIFINTLQAGIEYFLNGYAGRLFPPNASYKA